MEPVILFRPLDADRTEIEAARAHFRVIEQRAHVRRDDLVIGRYSVLPYYDELDKDVIAVGGQMLTSPGQHRYVADLSQWYEDVRPYTPKTWFRLQDVPKDDGPYVLKGLTNSRKQNWNTKMFAYDWDDVVRIWNELMDDPLISQQGVCVRKYVNLKEYPVKNVSGAPVTDEYRFFFLDNFCLTCGYYWSTHIDELNERGYFPNPHQVPEAFIDSVLNRLSAMRPRFLVIDFARTADDEWLVVELNDGQMSGLSTCEPGPLYQRLKEALACPGSALGT